VVWVNAVVQGILLGGLYALLAAGLSLMFGVMRIVNLAHGVLAVLAAYFGWVLITQYNMPWVLTFVIVIPVMAILGFVLQLVILNPALNRGGLSPILVTFGLAVVISNLLLQHFSANFDSILIGNLGTDSVQVNDQVSVGKFPVLIFVVAVLVIVALQMYLNRTRIGRAMRATSDDREAASLMGINNRRIYAYATAIAMATVGLAGIFEGIHTQFYPYSGDFFLIFAFEAVIIGGLGSLWGTLLGGIILGVSQTVGAQFYGAYGLLIGNIVFLIILAWKPKGLIPKAVNS
jgi:branched-chain amino acid transport system permease protein